jgi:ankyrin repeat protein
MVEHALSSLVLHHDGAVAKAASGSGEAKDTNSMTALLQAASDNWTEVRKLSFPGANPSFVNGQGLTALHYTAYYGSWELMNID